VTSRVRIRVDTTDKGAFYGIFNRVQKYLNQRGLHYDRFKVQWEDRSIYVEGLEKAEVETALNRILRKVGSKHLGGRIVHCTVEDLEVAEREALEQSIRTEYLEEIEGLKRTLANRGRKWGKDRRRYQDRIEELRGALRSEKESARLQLSRYWDLRERLRDTEGHLESAQSRLERAKAELGRYHGPLHRVLWRVLLDFVKR
jgi:hypothetical protein